MSHARLCVFPVVAWLAHAIGTSYAQELTNIAGPLYGTRVVADTEFSERHAGAMAVDGSLEPGTGCWYSRDQTPLPCALTLEFAGLEEIRQVNVVQAIWSGNMYHTKDFAVEVCREGEGWQRVAEGELPDESLARVEVRFEPVLAKKLRIVVLSSYNSFQTCGLAEVEVMAAGRPGFSEAQVRLSGSPAQLVSPDVCGLRLIAADRGPQVALSELPTIVWMALGPEESVDILVPVSRINQRCLVTAVAEIFEGNGVEATLGLSGEDTEPVAFSSQPVILRFAADAVPNRSLHLRVRGGKTEALVRVTDLRIRVGQREFPVPVRICAVDGHCDPPAKIPPLRKPMEQVFIEWDWRLQDGIETPRAPCSYLEAIRRNLDRGDLLVRDLLGAGTDLSAELEVWNALRSEFQLAAQTPQAMPQPSLEMLWRRVHRLKRQIAFRNPLVKVGPLLFVKQVPPCFSHQLTQYYGRYARPGGGLFVLERPGESMACQDLFAERLPPGSTMHPEVSYDGKRIVFAFCEADCTPDDTIQGHHGRYYHLYEMASDGAGLRQLTSGPYDDFAPKLMPDGRILFISTRRGGWHRCGNPGCENYTLAVAEKDGANPRPISFHETQEWDPAILNDGRIIYTRWDYVDRYAVLYQQLWTVLPDGSQPSSYYGNNTLNPVGVWEARPVPGSKRVMATAAAHHAMTAGAIVLVDVAEGVDGLEPLTRLTPDVPFPESESELAPSWHLGAPGIEPYEPIEERRWPGHCYRSPYPLSEKYFLASYSFERLVGEPHANRPNMFGLYLVDAFGNKELIYRDPSLSSLWPIPLRPRQAPPRIPSLLQAGPQFANRTSGMVVASKPGGASVGDQATGLMIVQNVRDSSPPLGDELVRRLRVLQVLPKSTPGIDRPPMGLPRGAPGKQVLGTVPVETDGSAYFRVPAQVPLSFQALDGQGMAIQVMRSETYVQPGETITCIGCHEPRVQAPINREVAALRRPPSVIEPGPEGSNPFSYPRLVQPVLNRHCVRCHGESDPAGGVTLTGRSDGHYTVSYNALAPRVAYSDQGLIDPLSTPNRFGARGSPLMKLLLSNHHGVNLNGEDLERLVTWMDSNALFYGTFDPEDQARQLRGEVIAGPKLQ